MSYLDIDNLYKNQTILQFKECYAMEKIHGTSAHISFKNGDVNFFSGGSKYEDFVKLFDVSAILEKLSTMFPGDKSVHIYGEAYGGKLQGMSATYGKELRFVVFEVKIGDCWLNVPNAMEFATKLGLDFVPYKRIPTTLEVIDAERDADSIQAVKNGMGPGHMREGIVLRPIEEVTLNNGDRVIAKHKRDEFRETNKPRKVVNLEQMQVLTDAKAIADEWVTFERLKHILTSGKLEAKIENTGLVIKAMIADIQKESKGEIVDSRAAQTQIGKSTALLFKQYLHDQITKLPA